MATVREVTVFDSKGAAIGGAYVQLIGQDGHTVDARTTDGEGYANFGAFVNGAITFLCLANGFLMGNGYVSDDSGALKIVLGNADSFQ